MTLVNLRSSKKKADVEVKVDEIKALHDTIDMVYKPIIEQQNKTIEQQNTRIEALDSEVKNLRKQLIDERSDHQKEIDMMNKRILAITNALGLSATKQIRDSKGRYAKEEDATEA